VLTERPGPASAERPEPVSADERHGGLRAVSCASCGASVLVAKFSPQHTSVQWSLAAMAACLEFGALTAAGEQSALIEGCASLRDNIDSAVASGRLQIEPP
jgi:hypothetical protein